MQRSGIFGVIDTAIAGASLLGIFLLAALATLSVFTLINNNKNHFGWMAALSSGLGPMVLSWLLTMGLRIFPGHPAHFYLWSLIASFSVIVALRAKFLLTNIRSTTKNNLAQFSNRPVRILALISSILIAFILLGLFSVGASLPISANDPLEYAQAARLIFEASSANIYPFIDSAQSNGFYGPWTHPLGYINLLTLGYMVQGTANYGGIIHLIAPYFAFASVIAVWNFAGQKNPLAGPIAALILVSTPLYFNMAAVAHIDTARIFTYFAVFVATWGYFRDPGFRSAIIVGICVGLSHFSHSIGILSLPVLIPIIVIVSFQPAIKRVSDILVVSVVGILIVLPSWMVNLQAYGSLAADQVEIWTFPSIHYSEYLAALRQLSTPLDKIFFGILKGFSLPLQYGSSYFLLVIALLVFVHTTRPIRNFTQLWNQKSFKTASPFALSLWVLAGYYGIVALSAILGMDLIIKNSRYILTVQPFVAIITAIVLSDMIASATQTFKGTLADAANTRSKTQGLSLYIRHKIKRLSYWAGFVWTLTKNHMLITVMLAVIGSFALIGNTLTFRQFSYFNINIQTQFDNEEQKFFASSFPSHQLIERIKNSTPENAKFLVFRESDFAFYTPREFIYHLDNKISQLFLLNTIEQAMEFLAQQNLTHIYVPPYPLPGIYNSIVGDLIASPSHAELVYDYSGFRLYKLRFNQHPVETQFLVGENFVQNPRATQTWQYTPGAAKPLDASSQTNSLYITHQNELLTTPLNHSKASRSSENLGEFGSNDGYSFGLQPGKTYQFTSNLEGKGFLEIFLETKAFEGIHTQKYIVPIWSGVLNGERRKAASIILDSISFNTHDQSLTRNREYTLVYRLNSGEFVRIFDWEIRTILTDQTSAGQIEAAQKLQLERQGWTIEGAINHARTPHYGLVNSNNTPTIFLSSVGNRTYHLISPSFYLPASRSDTSVNSTLRANTPIDFTQRPTIEISFDASGETQVTLGVQTVCQDATISNVARSRKLIEISTQTLEHFTTNFDANCFPARINANLLLQPNTKAGIVFDIPPLELKLSNLEIYLTYLDIDGQPIKLEWKQ